MTTDLKTNPFESDAFVYIRHLDAGELSGILPANAIDQIDEPEDLFVVAKPPLPLPGRTTSNR